MQHAESYKFIPEPFRIAMGVTIPVSGYEWQNVRASCRSVVVKIYWLFRL